MPKLAIIFACYLLLINLLAFVLYGIDKRRAIKRMFRIPEKRLLWTARLGGRVGSWLGIHLFHHKTKHTRFKIVVPLWIILWAVALVFVVIWRMG